MKSIQKISIVAPIERLVMACVAFPIWVNLALAGDPTPSGCGEIYLPSPVTVATGAAVAVTGLDYVSRQAFPGLNPGKYSIAERQGFDRAARMFDALDRPVTLGDLKYANELVSANTFNSGVRGLGPLKDTRVASAGPNRNYTWPIPETFDLNEFRIRHPFMEPEILDYAGSKSMIAWYSNPEDVPERMSRLLSFINNGPHDGDVDQFTERVGKYFRDIHPHANGNGRTADALNHALNNKYNAGYRGLNIPKPYALGPGLIVSGFAELAKDGLTGDILNEAAYHYAYKNTKNAQERAMLEGRAAGWGYDVRDPHYEDKFKSRNSSWANLLAQPCNWFFGAKLRDLDSEQYMNRDDPLAGERILERIRRDIRHGRGKM